VDIEDEVEDVEGQTLTNPRLSALIVTN